MMPETKVDIKGYEGLYSIDNYGRVYSHVRARYLKPALNGSRRYQVFLVDPQGGKKWRHVDELVLASFGFPARGRAVTHKNGDPFDNRLGNLMFE